MNAGLLQQILKLGTNSELGCAENRRIANSNLLNFISSVGSFLVAIFYLYLKLYLLGSLAIVVTFYFIGNLIFTRLGYNKLTRNISLFCTNLLLFFGASVLGRESGAIFIYFPLVCLGIFTFGNNEKLLTAFFLLLCFVTVQTLELTNYSLFASLYQIPVTSKSLYILHLNLGIFLTGFFVFYIFINFLESEEALAKSKDTLHAVFNDSPDALILANIDTMMIEDCNKMALKVFQVKNKSALLNIRCTELLKSSYRKEEIHDILKQVKSKKEWEDVAELTTKAGQSFWGNISIKILKTNSKELIYIRIADITERMLHEERLLSAHDELQHFVYKSSHNLKGPSASILGLINIAKKEISDPNSLQYLKMIETTSQRLDSTLTDLLNITKIKGGDTSNSQVDVSQVVNEIMEDLQFFPGIGSVSITTDINCPLLYSDKTIFKSILLNIVENAIKYRDPVKQSFVHIKGSYNLDVAKIEISDNGVGIPEQYQEKIFNMFFRVHDTSQGTGLGLYIAKNGIEKLNGNIALESEERAGTKFTITIPLPARQQ